MQWGNTTRSSTEDYLLHMSKDKSEGKRSTVNGIKVKSPLLLLAESPPDTNGTGCRNAFLLCHRREASIQSASHVLLLQC